MIQRIKEYLNARMITDDIIESANLSDGVFYNNFWIVIPIYDINGNHVFTKLRRDPSDEKNLSKYKYFPYGVKPELYGANKLNSNKESIYVCEGEFDTLVLQSHGLNAVSSTSGSGTFKEEWVGILCQYDTVYLALDSDEAGRAGAYKVYKKLAERNYKGTIFNITLLAKDITDYFVAGGDCKTLLSLAELVPVINLNNCTTELELLDAVENLLEIKRYCENSFQMLLTTELLEDVRCKLKKINIDKRFKNKEFKNKIDVEQIKSKLNIEDIMSIKPFKKSTKSKTYLCPIHAEDTPSFEWYKGTNSFYCFGCFQGGTIIDLYMKLNKCSFLEAITQLSKLI